MKLPTFFARKRNLYWSIAILVIIIIIISSVFGGSGSDSFPVSIKREKFINTVSITGKAVFDDKSDLGFDKSGRISAIYKKVGDKVGRGDIIASIDNGDINAELAQKQAVVDRERAKLDSTLEGTRPEQIQIYTQSFTDASNALIVAIRSAYLKAESALLTQVDTVFANGSSVNPEINIVNTGDSEKRKIENERLLLNESVKKWQLSISSLNKNSSPANLESARTLTVSTFSQLKTFMDNLSKITLDLNEGNSGYTTSAIDTIRDTINSASQVISTASNSFVTAETAYNSAKDTLSLAQSGSTTYDISAQSATLRAAEADLANTRARIYQTIISSPFSGIVTRIDAKIGEIVSPAESPVTVMNLDSLMIEAYVPEININQVKTNDLAKVTFDAFGEDEIFDGLVTAIDLAETVRDGVATYKIQVKLDKPSQYIRSGMTSDVTVTTGEKDNIITIPRGYLIREDGKYFVMFGTNSNAVKKEVTVGDVGSMSRVEILSGLEDGDSIVSPIASVK